MTINSVKGGGRNLATGSVNHNGESALKKKERVKREKKTCAKTNKQINNESK